MLSVVLQLLLKLQSIVPLVPFVVGPNSSTDEQYIRGFLRGCTYVPYRSITMYSTSSRVRVHV